LLHRHPQKTAAERKIPARLPTQAGAYSLTTPNRKLLTPIDVSELTGLSLNTLAQWRSRRCGIPYLKIGRKPMYDPLDVQKYLEGCRVSVSDLKEIRQK